MKLTDEELNALQEAVRKSQGEASLLWRALEELRYRRMDAEDAGASRGSSLCSAAKWPYYSPDPRLVEDGLAADTVENELNYGCDGSGGH